jgi:hypothetical protein
MTYAVIYGNYFPREVDTYWETKEKAVERMEYLNDNDPLKSRMWEIEETSSGDSDRLASLPATEKCECIFWARKFDDKRPHHERCPASPESAGRNAAILAIAKAESNVVRPPTPEPAESELTGDQLRNMTHREFEEKYLGYDTREPAESEGKSCPGCGTPEGQQHGIVCPVMLSAPQDENPATEEDAKAFADDRMAAIEDWEPDDIIEIMALFASQYAAKAVEKAIAEFVGAYNELIMAVGNKYPNETRHETALRYSKRRGYVLR